MSSRLRAAAITCGCVLLAGGASAASWQPVPGAPELQADLASARQERQRVRVWIRTAAAGAFAQLLPLPSPLPAGTYRTAWHAEFDCGRRTLRSLGAQGHDASGRLLFLNSLPGHAQPVPAGAMGWTYDSICEAARELAARELPARSEARELSRGSPAARCTGHPRARCVNAGR